MNFRFWDVLPVFVILVISTGSYAATIDVTDYGANGNDTADDTAAITAAVAALNEGDTLLFPDASLYYKVAVGAEGAPIPLSIILRSHLRREELLNGNGKVGPSVK